MAEELARERGHEEHKRKRLPTDGEGEIDQSVSCTLRQRPDLIDKKCITEIIDIFEKRLKGTDLDDGDPYVDAGISRRLDSQWVIVFFEKDMKKEKLRSLYDSIKEASEETNKLFLSKDDDPDPLVDITKIRYQTVDCEFKREGDAKKYSPEIRTQANCWNVPLGKYSIATSGYDPKDDTFHSNHGPEYDV